MEPETKIAYLTSCSDHYAHRLFAIDACLRETGYQTTYVTSDFDHSSKKKYTCAVPGCVQLPARPYEKNLSLARILNHRGYARDFFAWLETQAEPALVVAQLPPNYLAKYGAAYKRRHPKVHLVFDLFDLWPETFPSARSKKLLALPFSVWAGVRDRYLPAADVVTAECDLYRQKLSYPKIETVPLAARRLEQATFSPAPDAGTLILCYLGAINHLADVEGIAALIRALTRHKKVRVHVIGGGEGADAFFAALRATDAEVIDHGIVYDEREKHAILEQCHFGLNMMTSAVCVGLTMKSVDYFKHGLPILSNIPADTRRLIEEKGAGFQIEGDMEPAAARIAALDTQDLTDLRQNARRVFDECFDLPVIVARYREILKDIL